MANGTCEKISTDFKSTFLPTVYILVFVAGIVANCWGLTSVYRNWKKLGNIRVFVLNLGAADLLYVSTLPFLMAYYARGEWTLGDSVCKIVRFCFNLNLYGSIGFLTCISVYRYLGIVHPMVVKGRITTRHSVVISVSVWVLVSIQCIPDVTFSKSSSTSRSPRCSDTTVEVESLERYLAYCVGRTACGFALPLCIILCCYIHVSVVLMRGANVDALLKERCLKLVLILLLLFSICFVPYHALRLLNLSVKISRYHGHCGVQYRYQVLNNAYNVTRGLACLNSAINPIIYLYCNNDMRFHVIREKTRKFFHGLANRWSDSSNTTQTSHS